MTNYHKGVLLAALSGIGGGLFPIFYQQLSNITDAGTATFMLLVVAALLSTPQLVCKELYLNKSYSKINPKNIHIKYYLYLLALALLSILGNVSSAESLKVLSAATVQTILRSEVIFIVFISALVLNEKVSVDKMIGAITVFIGIFIMNLEDLSFDSFIAVLLALRAALSFAFLAVLFKLLAPIFSINSINIFRLVFSVVIFYIIDLSLLKSSLSSGGYAMLFAVLAAIVGPYLSRIFFTMSCRHISVAQASVINSLSPVLTFVLQAFFISSVFSLTNTLGIAITIAGIIYATLKF